MNSAGENWNVLHILTVFASAKISVARTSILQGAITMKYGLLLGSLILAGCVSTRNASLSADHTKVLQGKTIALSTRPRADFVAMTAGKAAFALVGAVAMIEAGNAIVKNNGIDDPTTLLGQSLLSEAEVRYGVVTATPPSVAIDTTDLAKMAHTAGNADLLLDVQSLG